MDNSTEVRGPSHPCISFQECVRLNCPDCAHPLIEATPIGYTDGDTQVWPEEWRNRVGDK